MPNEGENCLRVQETRFGFEMVDDGGERVWFFKVEKHPKYAEKEDLLAALKTVTSTNVASTPPPSSQNSVNSIGSDNTAPRFRPLPVGTEVEYDTWKFKVTNVEGFGLTFNDGSRWKHSYAVFGHQYTSAYGTQEGRWEFFFDDAAKSALESLWPLKIGKRARFEFIGRGGSSGNNLIFWNVEFFIKDTQIIDVAGKKYKTYVVEEHAKTDGFRWAGTKNEFVRSMWYHPQSGLIIKAEKKSSSGGLTLFPVDEFTLKKVTFPKDATNALVALDQSGMTAVARSKSDIGNTAPPSQNAELLATELARLQAESNRKIEAKLAELERLKKEMEASLKAAAKPVAPIDEELAFWQEVGNSRDEGALRQFVERYPDGRFSGDARGRLQQLKAERRVNEETRLWASIQSNATLQQVQEYLAKFPSGKHAGEATAKAAVLERFKLVDGVDFGTYHALVIGIDKYKHLQDLETAIKDARAVADVLENQYGFKVTLLENPARGDIVETFDELRETMTSNDNLLIYYAGHGWQDDNTDQGYWLASDAKSNRRTNWVSNATLTDTMKGLQAKHVMIVADSCFSGTLVRAADIGFEDADYKSGEYWRRMAQKQTRVAMVSGGLEPVADNGGSGHSPFAKAFIDALGENNAVIDGSALFNQLRRPVIVAARQTPQYSDVRNTGHDGGDFLFVRKR